MKTAKAVAMVLDVTCPHCDEPIEDANGSYMITSDSFPGDVVACVHCGKRSKLPKRVPAFVAFRK